MDLISAIFYLFIIAVVFTIILFVANKAPIEEPFKSVLIWIVYVVGAIVLVGLLLQLAGIHTAFNLTPLRLR